jgi:hypothetical protein
LADPVHQTVQFHSWVHMQFGEFRVEVVPDCEFRLDGGAMFGVVPRTLWSRASAPDDQNRIALNMNCLFVEAGRERILIDTGIGEKWSPKHETMYAINRKRPLAEYYDRRQHPPSL